MSNPFGNPGGGAGLSQDPNLGAGQGNSFGAFGPDIAQAQTDKFNAELANPLGLQGYSHGYDPRTFSQSDISYVNGQLMGNLKGQSYELRPWDILDYSVTTPSVAPPGILTDDGLGFGPTTTLKSAPIGSFKNLKDLLGYGTSYDKVLGASPDGQSGLDLYNQLMRQGRRKWNASQYDLAKATPFEDYSNIINPLNKDFDPFEWFAGDPKRRLLLYGAYGAPNDGGSWGFLTNRNKGAYGYFDDDNTLPNYQGLLTGYSGEEWSPTGKGGRWVTAERNARNREELMARAFPHLTAEELDRVAWKAMTDTSRRAKEASGRPGRYETYHYGRDPYIVDKYLMDYIARETGASPEKNVSDYITDPERLAKGPIAAQSFVRAAHAADDADDFGLGDFLSVAAPLALMAFGIPSLGFESAVAGELAAGEVAAGAMSVPTAYGAMSSLAPMMAAPNLSLSLGGLQGLGLTAPVADAVMSSVAENAWIPSSEFYSSPLSALGEEIQATLGSPYELLKAAGENPYVKFGSKAFSTAKNALGKSAKQKALEDYNKSALEAYNAAADKEYEDVPVAGAMPRWAGRNAFYGRI